MVTPNYMHAPGARAALAAGKPCSCEKPIAGTVDDAREMVEAAKAGNVKTFVWFNYRRCPDAHIIGYEHGFTNQAYDILRVLAGEEPTVPIPDFNDAYQTQRVLEASLLSAAERRPVLLEEVKRKAANRTYRRH